MAVCCLIVTSYKTLHKLTLVQRCQLQPVPELPAAHTALLAHVQIAEFSTDMQIGPDIFKQIMQDAPT